MGRHRCDNMNDFVRQLHSVFSESQLCNKCVYIVRLISCLHTAVSVEIGISNGLTYNLFMTSGISVFLMHYKH